MTYLSYAIKATLRGWYVFPVEPGAKTPMRVSPGKPWTIRWSEKATRDPNRIVAWWNRSPYANIGIACKQSGLLVVDCDMPKRHYQLKGTQWEHLHEKYGSLVDGGDVLREMCVRFGDDYSRLERTYRVSTASMGLHLYFRWPDGIQASQASPVPGMVDIRCNGGQKGGYVLGAGSATEKGPYVAENDLPVADAPGWLVELCRDTPKLKPVRDVVYSQPVSGSLAGVIESVRLAPEGNRSNCLYWAARAFYDDGVKEEEAIEKLTEAAQVAGLPYREAEQTILSGYRGQARKSGK